MQLEIPDSLAYAIIDGLYTSTHPKAGWAQGLFQKLVQEAKNREPWVASGNNNYVGATLRCQGFDEMSSMKREEKPKGEKNGFEKK